MLVMTPGATCPGLAMSSDAVTALATRLAPELPVSAHWTRAQDATLESTLGHQLELESLDPEPFASRHRFDVTQSGAEASRDPAASGGAIDELFAATRALSAALAAPDASALASPLVRLARSACDLADPFLTTAPDADEIPGARAAFTELFDRASFDATADGADGADGLRGAASAIATGSAAAREAVEQAVATGDDAVLNALRNRRLAASLALARGAVQRARADAAATMSARLTPGRLAIWPNPAHGSVRVSFILPATGTARLELLDVAGRNVLERSLGVQAQGEHSLVLDTGDINALPAGMYFVRVHGTGAPIEGRLFRVNRQAESVTPP